MKKSFPSLPRQLGASLVSLLLLVIPALTHAATLEAFTLTGGDANEGFCPRSQAVIAVDLNPAVGQTDKTIQGVVFKPYANQSQVITTVGWPGATACTVTVPGSTTNDTNLATILGNTVKNYWNENGNALVVTISGLIPGYAYQADLFLGDNSNLYSNTFRFWCNGDSKVIELKSPNPGTSPIAPTVVSACGALADSNGKITLKVEGYDYYGGAYMFANAVAVTRGQAFEADPAKKKIIELGWDAQMPDGLDANLSTMQTMPFNGVGYKAHCASDSNPSDSIGLFDVVAHPETDYPLTTLQSVSTKWGKFTDNYLWVHHAHWYTRDQFNWTDDAKWANIIANAKNVSKCLATAKNSGIAFDGEHYYDPNPWAYNAQNCGTLTFAEAEAKARQRGRELMNALETHMPSLKILAFGLISNGAGYGGETGEYALQAAFGLGLLEGANPGSVIMDASESMYHMAKTCDASYYYSTVRGLRNSSWVPTDLRGKFDLQYQAAMAINLNNSYESGFFTPTTPLYTDAYHDTWWKHNVYYAMRATDSTVWVYSEYTGSTSQPVNWYTGANLPTNAKTKISEALTLLTQHKKLGYSIPWGPPQYCTSPTATISAPATNANIARTSAVTVSYTVGSDCNWVDTLVDGLSFANLGPASSYVIPTNSLMPGKHQVVIRAWKNDGSSFYNDSNPRAFNIQ